MNSGGVIFNTTFTKDKPIYYPSTWATGKTAVQLYEEFKLTTQFWIMRNVLESFVGAVWVFLLYVIISAVKEVYRLSKLPSQSRERKQNRKFLQSSFLLSAGFVVTIIMTLSFSLLILQPWTRFVLLKGVISWIVFFICYFIWKKIAEWRAKRRVYRPIPKLNQD